MQRQQRLRKEKTYHNNNLSPVPISHCSPLCVCFTHLYVLVSEWKVDVGIHKRVSRRSFGFLLLVQSSTYLLCDPPSCSLHVLNISLLLILKHAIYKKCRCLWQVNGYMLHMQTEKSGQVSKNIIRKLFMNHGTGRFFSIAEFYLKCFLSRSLGWSQILTL